MEGIIDNIFYVRKAKANILFKLLLVFACFSSFGVWLFVWINETVIHFIVLFSVLIIVLAYPKYFKFEKKATQWFIVLLIALYEAVFRMSFFGQIDKIIAVLPFLFIVSLKEEYKSDILQFLLYSIGYGMAISLFFYFLCLTGVPLPHSKLSIGHYDFNNYYFFYQRLSLVNSLLPFPRFSFVFYEPGYTGCIIALLIHALSYDFKKHKIMYVLLVALFFTMSLAGWLIATIGFILYKLGKRKERIGWLIFISLFLIAFVQFFQNYKGGDNIVNTAILERLQSSDNEYAIITGYNRSSKSLREYFWGDFIHGDQVWFGRPDYFTFFEEEETMIADWTSYVIRHGWVGLILFLLFVFFPALSSRQNKYELLTFSVVFLLIFFQTIFLIYGYMYLTVYTLGCSEIARKEKS